MDRLSFVKSKNEEMGVKREIRVTKGLRVWFCGVLVDEQKWIEEKVEALKEKIRSEVKKKQYINTGTGFFIFSEEKYVKVLKHFGK